MFPSSLTFTLHLIRLFVSVGHTDTVASLAFSRDGQLLASGGLDGVVNVWESSTGNLKHKLEGPDEGIDVSIYPGHMSSGECIMN